MGQSGKCDLEVEVYRNSVLISLFEDCNTAPYSNTFLNFPSALFNHSELMTYFSTEFGFTEREVTALLGAHTLGRANIFNSGFNGVWVSNEQVRNIVVRYF